MCRNYPVECWFGPSCPPHTFEVCRKRSIDPLRFRSSGGRFAQVFGYEIENQKAPETNRRGMSKTEQPALSADAMLLIACGEGYVLQSTHTSLMWSGSPRHVLS
jgi:hypothetical protein